MANVSENLDRYFAFFGRQIGGVQGVAPEIYQKVLLASIVDSLAQGRYPNLKHGDRYKKLICTYFGWKGATLVSIPQLLLRLREESSGGKLLDFVMQKIGEVPRSQPIEIEKVDCSFDKLRPLASNSDRKIISSCQHYNLLYQQRNFLVHEFREPGYGLGFNGHFAGPHYEHHLNADSSSRLELVYPVGFVFKCVLASLEKLRIHYQKEKIDPYSSYEFGSLWHHKSGNKN